MPKNPIVTGCDAKKAPKKGHLSHVGTTYPSRDRSQRRPVQRSIEQLRNKLLADHKRLKNWRNVGDNWGVKPGTLNRIATSEYEPKDPHIRVKLGLSSLEPAPVCRRCGEVHVTKRCTRPPPPNYKRLVDMPVDVLKWKLENRESVG